MTRKCIYCDTEFEHPTWQRKICDDCFKKLYTSPKQEEKRKKKNPNQALIDDVKKATALGLSYGTFKGGTYAR